MEVPQRKSLLKNNCWARHRVRRVGSRRPPPAHRPRPGRTTTAGSICSSATGHARQLFLNDGKGHFTDIAQSAGVDRNTFAKGVTAADYDNDGRVDFYVSNYDGPNQLYHNNGDGTFTDRAGAAGVPGAGRGFATWFFDYDNDGWQDLYVTSYFMSLDDTARTYLGLPHNAPTMKLYRNRGNGTFEDVTKAVGLDKVFMPMGANFGDIDNDGFLDLYLA